MIYFIIGLLSVSLIIYNMFKFKNVNKLSVLTIPFVFTILSIIIIYFVSFEYIYRYLVIIFSIVTIAWLVVHTRKGIDKDLVNELSDALYCMLLVGMQIMTVVVIVINQLTMMSIIFQILIMSIMIVGIIIFNLKIKLTINLLSVVFILMFILMLTLNAPEFARDSMNTSDYLKSNQLITRQISFDTIEITYDSNYDQTPDLYFPFEDEIIIIGNDREIIAVSKEGYSILLGYGFDGNYEPVVYIEEDILYIAKEDKIYMYKNHELKLIKDFGVMDIFSEVNSVAIYKDKNIYVEIQYFNSDIYEVYRLEGSEITLDDNKTPIGDNDILLKSYFDFLYYYDVEAWAYKDMTGQIIDPNQYIETYWQKLYDNHIEILYYDSTNIVSYNDRYTNYTDIIIYSYIPVEDNIIANLKIDDTIYFGYVELEQVIFSNNFTINYVKFFMYASLILFVFPYIMEKEVNIRIKASREKLFD